MGLSEESMLKDLKDIIDNKSIRTLFQPIINLKTAEILGYEALSRGPKGSSLESPLKLFSLAKKHNMLFNLEQLCREKALLNTQNIEEGNKLFLNIDPGVIYDSNFKAGTTKEIINNISISQNDIVIELTETTCIDDFQGFRLALNHYTDQGYQIAIDDTGAGYSGLQSIVSISYNYIKLDRSLVMNIDQDPVKQALLETFMRFAKKINSKVIAEGIETVAELDILIQMGVDYGQGYLIARPDASIPKKLDISDYILAKNNEKNFLSPKYIIGNIASKSLTVNIDSKVNRVKKTFKEDPKLFSLAVLEDEKIVGLVTRNQFLDTEIDQFKGIDSMLKAKTLVVDFNTSIEEVLEKVTKRNSRDFYDCVIVTQDNKYFGTVSIKDILSFFQQLNLNQEIENDAFNNFSKQIVM
ncbi:EAL domain-containing protein [Orenia marismortui]|uniref:EAL domain-containing protein n=1 Tax=Orenia marismortui TaxID=46469 RepID=UPI00038023CE|nr:EAL domain-containing protein [Orenia marismortui]